MKKFTLICAMLALSSCWQKAKDDYVIVANDSSPIIISDGSVRINQKSHFRIHRGRIATVKLGKHTPTLLGYRCDPPTPISAGTCNSDCAKGVKELCSLDLNGLDKWTLDVTDDSQPPTITQLRWKKSTDNELIEVKLPKDYCVEDGANGGVDLVASPGNLQSASITTFTAIKSVTYNFDCKTTTSKTCLTIGYYCPSGCP